LTDLHLLDGSALSLIDALRQRSDIPETMAVIALTADTRTAATSLALAHGADRVVTKPVRGPELVAQVSEVLLKRGALDDEPVPRRLNRAV
jgi:DNA-binding response OmpR family regulator